MRRFCQDEGGATVIEYALITAFIAIALITVLGTLGTDLRATFVKVDSGFHQ